MKIEKIKICNFRALEEVTVDFDGYFSSISGKNNAGKTTVVKSIKALLKGHKNSLYFFEEDDEVSYSSDKTQWTTGAPPISFEYTLSITKFSDPGLHSFIAKIAEIDNLPDDFSLVVIMTIKEKNERATEILIGEKRLGKYETGEIFQRLSSSNIVFLHNSTSGNNKLFYPTGAKSFHEMILSKDEKEELQKEQERIKRKVKRFAQDHKGELSGLLGKLEDSYEVELTVFEGFFRNSIPLGISLKDKNLEVPLDDWGAGTQNRTHIMMSILSASRIKQQKNDENRITPIIIIEEPESFLHPSAQAEFGRVIRGLARELGIQIIITTHSPYMLCQESPESNVLLDRRLFRGIPKGTKVVSVTSEQWMEPFSQILGLNDESIEPWRDAVKTKQDNAILVEGPLDKEYLEHISSLGIRGYKIPEGIDIVPYGGKDALKNSIMLKFVIEKFSRVFITFDLDAKHELERIMRQLSLVETADYMAVGMPEDGKECIEGLVPQSVLSRTYSKHTNLVMKMTSADAAKRKSAKNSLKRLILEELKQSGRPSSSELRGFKDIFANIDNAFK